MRLVARVGLVTGWIVVVVLLALWLVEAIHRGHLTGELIVATGLAAMVVVPLAAARIRS